MKISIIIPAYNEVRTLPELLVRVHNAPMPEGCTREIIVVDDCSVDGTTAVLDEFSSNVRVQKTKRNCGKGSAIRAGITVATGDVILIQDGDLEYDPRDYKSVLAPLVDG